MAILNNVTPLYMGRQFTAAMANAGQDTNGRVIHYDEYPTFYCRAWDDRGSGADIYFEVKIYQRTGAAPPYTYAAPPMSTFNVNSRDNPEFFYDQQYYKSGEECVINYRLLPDASRSLATYAGGGNIFAIEWIARDREDASSHTSNTIEFTYISDDKLIKLEEIDFVSFDRVTIYRPTHHDPPHWFEVDAPLIPLSVEFDEPFESAPRTLRLTFPDPDGLFLPQSQDNINYIGGHTGGYYSPVFRLGNRVAYEKSLAYGTQPFGWTNLTSYADASRYRYRVWFLPLERKTPWVMQTIQVRRSFDGGASWETVQAGDEFDFFQYGIFFREDQDALGVTDIQAKGQYYLCSWEYAGLFYMGAPEYSNNPDTGNTLSVDCQDRLSLLDKNGPVHYATCEIQKFADKLMIRQALVDDEDSGTGYPFGDCIKTWQDPELPDGLLLYFYDPDCPAGNYAGDNPIDDGTAAVWDDEFEITVEAKRAAFGGVWQRLPEDCYQRTPYGILFDRDWSAAYPAPHWWAGQDLRITFQMFVKNTNPINEIIKEILEYPNYDETVPYGGPGAPEVPGKYGGPGLDSDDYSIPGIGGTSEDDWMDLDVNRFIWNHFNGSALEAIKEVMRAAGFPYNYRITAEPNPLWALQTHDPPEDIITFREVSQYPMEDIDKMLMLPIDVHQKMEEDRLCTMVRTRVFDDFTRSFSHQGNVTSFILWGPNYEGGFNRNTINTALKLYRDDLLKANINLRAEWNPEYGTDTDGWNYFTDNDIETHIFWSCDTDGEWAAPYNGGTGYWYDFIATPIMELLIEHHSLPFNLAALDIRNSNFYDYMGLSEYAQHQEIGIKIGFYGDRITIPAALGGLIINGNQIQNVLPGAFVDYGGDDSLVGATLQISQNAADPTDRGNTYPIVANDDTAGTIDVEIRDSPFFPNMQTQLNDPLQGQVQCFAKRYHWLPNFNRKLSQPQDTIEWENQDFYFKDVRYIEVWVIKPAVGNRYGGHGKENDMYVDLADIFLYDEGVTIGRGQLARIRSDAPEFPNESEDLDFGSGAFYRRDLFNRFGIRTHILPDDKAITTDDKGFVRCCETLYEDLVVEDSYQINGVYYPHIPRYSTILLNVESMRIAFPALLESRSFSFAGVERSYEYTLRNYNNLIWPHMETPEYS